jgi:hypothetical protein
MYNEEETKERIQKWFAANRTGSQKDSPYYWTLYPVKSPTQQPTKQAGVLGSYYEDGSIEDSVTALVDLMDSSPNTRYFAIRLRSKQGDTGVFNNYTNPFYQSSRTNNSSRINGLSQSNNTDMEVLKHIAGITDDRTFYLQQSHAQEIARLKEKHEGEIKGLKENFQTQKKIDRLENIISGLENPPKGDFLQQFIEGIAPTLQKLLEYKMIGSNTSYEEGSNTTDSREETEGHNNELLEQGLENLSTVVNTPEELVYKISIGLITADAESQKTFLSMVQAQYNEALQQKRNNG